MPKNTIKLHNYRLDKYTTSILGIKVDFINLQNALSLVEKWLKINKQYQITTPNPEHIVLAKKDYRFKEILNQSDLAIADGVGLVWAGKLIGFSLATNCDPVFESHTKKDKNFPLSSGRDAVNTKTLSNLLPSPKIKFSRLSGIDLMIALCKLASQKKWRVFLLGAKPGIAQKSTTYLKEGASLTDVDYHSGAKNIENETKKENKRVIKKINAFKPHLLFVAYGAPWQEKWIYNNLPKLQVKVAMGVGGAFDYLAGRIKRAPNLIRKLGLEWLWRLLKEPLRAKRQLALAKFIWLVMTYKQEK